MTSWTELPLACFDIESTGIDVFTDQVVTAFLGRINGEDVERRNWIAQPTIPIPAEATAIHGLDDDYVRKHGRPHDQVVAEIVDAIYQAWERGHILCGFNLSYDLSLLATWHPGFEVRGPIFDAFVVDKRYDRFRKGSRKLSAVCIHYGMRLDDAHDAEADAVAAARLAWKLPRVFPELATYSASELMRHQTTWYAEQAASLIKYLEREGRDTSDVRTTWPIQHNTEAQAA